nr:hypothetical protein Iba_chr13fCG2260 [Ipomoea batatas]
MLIKEKVMNAIRYNEEGRGKQTPALLRVRRGFGSGEPLSIQFLDPFDFKREPLDQKRAGRSRVADFDGKPKIEKRRGGLSGGGIEGFIWMMKRNENYTQNLRNCGIAFGNQIGDDDEEEIGSVDSYLRYY